MVRNTTRVKSRQKSCITCARGKRRCDRQTPQCHRCLILGLDCVYKKRNTLEKDDCCKKDESCAGTELVPVVSDPETNLAWDITEPLPSPFSSDESWSSPLDLDIYLNIAQIPPVITPIPTTFYPNIAPVDRWSLNQLLRHIRTYPSTFARSGTTHFIHHQLYSGSLPDAMQEAFVICTAYISKTSSNEEMVYRILENKSTTLTTQDGGGLDYKTCSLPHLLSKVQYLILLSIIQLFDGDTHQRYLAEQNSLVLSTWTTELQIRSNTLEIPNPRFPGTTKGVPTWKQWILHESLRRTILLSTLLGSLWSCLQLGYCTSIPLLAVLPFTPSEGLWAAKTELDFYKLVDSRVEDKGTLETVLYGAFSQSWQKSTLSWRTERETGIGVWEKMLLTPCMGEGYRGFLEVEWRE